MSKRASTATPEPSMGRKPEKLVTNADDEGENDRRLTTLDTKTRHPLSESRLIQPLIFESNCYGALGALASVQASCWHTFLSPWHRLDRRARGLRVSTGFANRQDFSLDGPARRRDGLLACR